MIKTQTIIVNRISYIKVNKNLRTNNYYQINNKKLVIKFDIHKLKRLKHTLIILSNITQAKINHQLPKIILTLNYNLKSLKFTNIYYHNQLINPNKIKQNLNQQIYKLILKLIL